MTMSIWEITDPSDVDIVLVNPIHGIKTMLLERLDLDHDIDGGTDDEAYHKQVPMAESAYDGSDLNLDPVYSKIEDDVGVLYTNEVDGVTELFYLCKIDTSLGVPEHHYVQITSGGGLT